MRLWIGISALCISVWISIIIYNKYKFNHRFAEFLYNFSCSAVRNNQHEMKPIFEIFEDEYLSSFSTQINMESTPELVDFLTENSRNNVDYKEYIIALNNYLSAALSEITENGDLLIQAAENLKNKELKCLSEKGKTVLLLFPALTLMILILLI